MEQFEKWLKNHKHANWTWEEDAKDAWRAALEEILKQLKQPIYSADIMAWIEKELKGGD